MYLVFLTGLIIYTVEMILMARASSSLLKYLRHMQSQLSILTVGASIFYLLCEVSNSLS